MNKLEVGNTYRCKVHRTGTSAKTGKDWELISTYDEKNHCQITVWVVNGPIKNLSDGGQFMIDRIDSVSFGNKKNSQGNWESVCSINATVAAIPDEFGSDGLNDVSSEFGDDNPFDDMSVFM